MTNFREWYRPAPSFEAVFGINHGYFHNNGLAVPADELVASVWQRNMAVEFANSGILVSSVVTAGRVAYLPEHGCPVGGEVIATVKGQMIDKFMPMRLGSDAYSNETKYMNAVIRIVEDVKQELHQERVQVTFNNVDSLLYLIQKPETET